MTVSRDIVQFVGHRIREHRQALGLTLTALADRCGLSLPYLSNLEHGRGNPTLDALCRVADALEIPLVRLMDARLEQLP